MSHDDALDVLIATAKARDVPPDGAEDQAWAAFAGGLGGEGSDLPLGAEAATAGGAKLGLAIKVLAAISVVSAASAGAARWSRPAPEPSASVEPSATPASAPASVEPPAPTPPSVAAAAVPPPSVAPEQVKPVSRPAAPTSPDKPAPPPPAPSPSTLAQEARLVGTMWRLLDRGDAKRALSLARSHGTRFAGGALDLEARAAALAARCVLRRPIDLHELESVQKTVTRSVAKRVSAACARKP